MRFRFIAKKTPRAELQTSNIERKELGVGRGALRVLRKNDSRLEFLDHHGRISCDNHVRFDALGDH
jgi:hypothetical protein